MAYLHVQVDQPCTLPIKGGTSRLVPPTRSEECGVRGFYWVTEGYPVFTSYLCYCSIINTIPADTAASFLSRRCLSFHVHWQLRRPFDIEDRLSILMPTEPRDPHVAQDDCIFLALFFVQSIGAGTVNPHVKCAPSRLWV